MNTAPKSQNQTINMEIYIVASYDDYSKKFQYSCHSYDPTPYNKEYVLIGKQDIQVVVPPEKELIPSYVSGLEDTKQKIRAEMHQKIEDVQARINRVLALEYVPLDNSTESA